MVDLQTGRRERTRDRLLALIDEVSPAAAGVVGDALIQAARLVEHSPAAQQREVMGNLGAEGLTEWLAGRFLEE
jgi:hypothetical protein